VALASFIGTTIEWYDFFLYGTAAALVLSRLYFPTFDPSAGKMAAFATYAVGFMARPLGGLFFGHLGDRVGRKATLVTTLLMMGVCTFAIGLLPTYGQIGIAAPVLLVILRFIQGLGVGGEWGGAVLMASEHASDERRGFFASWPQAGVPMGLLLATIGFGASARLPEEQFMAWGWRVPFLAGILLAGVGLIVRLHILESPMFVQIAQSGETARSPIREVLRQPRAILLGAGSRLAENTWFYLVTVFMLSYATTRLGLSDSLFLDVLMAACVLELITLPAFGALSDVVGRRSVYLFGTVFSAVYAWPAFWLMETRTPLGVVLAIVPAIVVGHAAMYGPQAAFFCELFGTRVRCTGASLGYQLGSVLSGGFAPLIATALLEWSGGRPWPVALYVVGMAALSVLSIAFAVEVSTASSAEESRRETVSASVG
jgi:metabolite-proton symporter